MKVVDGHVVRHRLRKTRILRRWAMRVLREGHITYASVKFENVRVLGRLGGQRARDYRRDTLFAPARFPCRN